MQRVMLLIIAVQIFKQTKENKIFTYSYGDIPICTIPTFLEADIAFSRLSKIKGDADLAEQACLDLGSMLQIGPSSQAGGNVYP